MEDAKPIGSEKIQTSAIHGQPGQWWSFDELDAQKSAPCIE